MVTARSAEVGTVGKLVSELAEELEAEARSAEVGDLFQYEIKQKLTINKNQSALVPILNAPVEAEKVTLWTARGNESAQRPLRALWLNNSSGLTLDAGTFNVLEADTFAGEGLMQALKPGEKRLLSYAVDTAVQVNSRQGSESEPVTRIRAAKGVMTVTRGERKTTLYKVRNSDAAAREVVLEHPAEEGWKLAPDLKPEESSASYHRFRVKVGPAETAELKVQELRPEETEFALTTMTPEQVTFFVSLKAIPPALEETFRRVLAKKNEISQLEAQIRERQNEVNSITADQSRVRENMKALKGSAEEKALLQRYTRQLDAQEDRLATLRKELADLGDKRERAGAELDRMVQEVSLDATL